MRNPEVGKRIREVRQRLNLTQAEFGKRLGVKKLSIVRYESGAVSRLDVLRKTANLGDVTLAWLLQGEEPQTLSETHPTASVQHVPEPLVRVLDRLRTELTSQRLALLSPSGRRRYEARAKEVLIWAQRQLEEYRALLLADSHTFRIRRR
jgi:transcriptional regulator with XRE-family HTH domain